jgi:hypothetical protein
MMDDEKLWVRYHLKSHLKDCYNNKHNNKLFCKKCYSDNIIINFVNYYNEDYNIYQITCNECDYDDKILISQRHQNKNCNLISEHHYRCQKSIRTKYPEHFLRFESDNLSNKVHCDNMVVIRNKFNDYIYF